MAEIKQLDTRLITRNDTEANWIANDPVLMPGEVAISIAEETTTGSGVYTLPKFKVGIDNVKKWSEIEYCLDTADLIEKINNIKPTTENTYFTEDMTVTYQFGKYVPDSSGSVTVPTKDKSVYEALLDAFAEAKNPSVDYPSVSISASGGEGEVGTTFTLPTATLKIDDVGSYTYGSKDDATPPNEYDAADTGVVFATGDVTLKQSDDNSVTNTADMNTGDTITLQATGSTTYSTDSISFTFSGTAKYTQSDRVPVNNLGTKVPDLQITTANATVSSKTVTFKGYRKCFWGYRLTADALADPASITSAQVRDATIIQKSGKTLPTTYTVPADTKQVYFLAPNGTKSSLSITNRTALNAPVACELVESGVQVEGANGYAATAYDLWFINLDAAFSGSAELVLTWK